jgi:hypothetical protein
VVVVGVVSWAMWLELEERWRSAKQRDFILPATNGASAGDRE